MGIFKKIVRIIKNDKYRKNPDTLNLTPEQYIALNVGAINAEQAMYYCDSVETGTDIGESKRNLSAYYGITNCETASDTLDWLRDRGHRICFEAIKDFVIGKTSAINDSLLEESEKGETYAYINNLDSSIEILMENNFINSRASLSTLSIIAWDMGRLITIARCCYECGYLSEEEAWKYILVGKEKCEKHYSNWREIANAYVVGRSMWSGNNAMLSGIMNIAEGLLENEDSPWLEHSFK